MEEKKDSKMPFFIILAFSIIVVVAILVFEKGSKVLNQSKYENLDKIVIDSEYSNIEVKLLDTDSVSILIYGKKDDELSVKEENKVLTIKKTSTKGVCLINCDDKIILYLPKEFERLDITTEMGDINAKDVTINDINIKSKIGNVKLGTIKSANIETEIGNVTIENFEGEFDSYIKTDTGNVTIKKTKNLNIDAKTTSGKVNVKDTKDNDYELKIETNIGNIKVK